VEDLMMMIFNNKQDTEKGKEYLFEDEENKIARKRSKVLIEKYRPLSVKNIILPPRYKKMFK
jgi:hypothetical protein